MFTVSDAFITATQQGGTVVTRADVMTNGKVIASGLPVTGGTVSVDLSASVRRRCTVSLGDFDGTYTPLVPEDMLSPYGNELALYRGFELDGTEELAALGIFHISDSDVTDEGWRSLSITGYDRARSVSRARLEAPYTVASGINYATAIQTLIDSRLPDLTYTFAETTAVTPLLVLEEEADPWDEASKMATAIGMILYFDVFGVCTLSNEPDASTTAPVVVYSEGENASITSLTDTFSDETGYNGFIVMGEPVDGTPRRAEAWDNDPTSPTYYLGEYGRVPRFFRSQFITTQAQADDAARAGLLRQTGATEKLSLTATVNPALEVGDVVQVQRAALSLDSPYVVESFEVPLEVESSMTLALVKRRAVDG